MHVFYRGLERLVILRCLRPDALLLSIRKFITDSLGPAFTRVSNLSLLDSFKESDRYRPLILILSPGADPLSAIDGLKKQLEASGSVSSPSDVTTLSLGQGQGQVAERAVLRAAETGGWVTLQNCHLAEKWMEQLANLWEEEVLAVESKQGKMMNEN